MATSEGVRCLVDGCKWKMEAEFELREDGESHIDLHLNTHKIDELQNAARNGMLIDGVDDPLQEKTANIYVRAFLQWVWHQNNISFTENGCTEVSIPDLPNEAQIDDFIDSFIETDYRFGN